MYTMSKRIALYCAETKKNKQIVLKTADFKSPEEMQAYIDKLKADNREKNKAYKTAAARQRIEAVLQDTAECDNIAEDPADAITAPESPKPVKKAKVAKTEKVEQLTKQMPVSSTISINLTPNTGNTIVIYGASKKGKTTLMMHLYNKYFTDSSFIATLFSANPHLRIYKDRRLLISYGFNQRSAKYIQLQQFLNVKTKNRYKFVNLFDDILDTKYSPIVNRLICTFRNSNISTIMCLQYVYMLSVANRSSVNHTLVFGSNTSEDATRIIKALLKPYLLDIGLRSLDEQLTFYKQATADHGFIYLDNVKNKMSLHRLNV